MIRIGQNDGLSGGSMSLNSPQELIDELRHGRMVVLADAEDRENEGDLVLAADFVTPEAINFMACLLYTSPSPRDS